MKFVTVFNAFSPAEAELVAARLKANDFLVNVKNETAAFSMEGYAMAVGGVQVQVPEDQEADARELIASKDAPSADE